MTRGDPPRHIRDIAHLYLSRMRRPGGNAMRLVVAGSSPDVLPGFHVANLALAAAAGGATVRIEERSGLPVNAGCFLGLDPRCWVTSDNGGSGPVSAFARVSFLLHPGGESAASSSRPETADAIDIVHIPPCDAGAEHARAISSAACAAPTVVLYLAERDEEPRPWRQNGQHSDVIRRVAYVTRAGRAGVEEGCVGVFTRWKRSLTDPLPIVVRDRDSRLARQYMDAFSTLLTDAGPAAHFARPRLDRHAAAPLEPR